MIYLLKELKIMRQVYIFQQMRLLYLPAQIDVPIGGERVACHESKLTNSLGKQQLKLLIRTWSVCAPWNGGKFVSQSAWCQKAIKIGQRFWLEKAFSIFNNNKH